MPESLPRRLDQRLAGSLEVPRESQPSGQVDHLAIQVEAVVQLGCRVVPREGVVVVVVSFAERRDGDPGILDRSDGRVVGFAAEHVGRRVDEPSGVEGREIASDEGREGEDQRLSPTEDGDRDWQDDCEDPVQGIVVPG